MNHLDDGTLQAFLDDELPAEDRAAVAEHLLACGACRQTRDELGQANAVFADAVAILDHEAPPAPPADVAAPARSTGWSLGGPFIKAASLTLLVAAAASAAVPGSPVREWIVRTVEPEPATETSVVAEEEATEPVAVDATDAAVPVGVSLPGRSVDIVVTDLQDATLRLVETDGENVTISALGGASDPVFNTGPGRIEVRGAVGGEVRIELPRAVSQARVVVDGVVYAEKADGELEVRVSGQTADGATIWR